MNIPIKKLDNALKAFEEIKKLDNEIIQIEKAAILVSQKKTEIFFKLSINDLEQEPDKKPILDEDGSLTMGLGDSLRALYAISMFGPGGGGQAPHMNYTIDIHETIQDTLALQMLGVLIQSKQARRETLIRYLQKMGVEL